MKSAILGKMILRKRSNKWRIRPTLRKRSGIKMKLYRFRMRRYRAYGFE